MGDYLKVAAFVIICIILIPIAFLFMIMPWASMSEELASSVSGSEVFGVIATNIIMSLIGLGVLFGIFRLYTPLISNPSKRLKLREDMAWDEAERIQSAITKSAEAAASYSSGEAAASSNSGGATFAIFVGVGLVILIGGYLLSWTPEKHVRRLCEERAESVTRQADSYQWGTVVGGPREYVTILGTRSEGARNALGGSRVTSRSYTCVVRYETDPTFFWAPAEVRFRG